MEEPSISLGKRILFEFIAPCLVLLAVLNLASLVFKFVGSPNNISDPMLLLMSVVFISVVAFGVSLNLIEAYLSRQGSRAFAKRVHRNGSILFVFVIIAYLHFVGTFAFPIIGPVFYGFASFLNLLII